MPAQDSHWTSRIADSVKAGSPNPLMIANLDDVIRWITEKPDPATDHLNQAFQKRKIPLAKARHQTLALIARSLFTGTTSPWHMLGLRETDDAKTVKVRYQRLMQVFHPDKGLGEEAWLNDCINKIRSAYQATENPPTVTPVHVPVSNPKERDKGDEPSSKPAKPRQPIVSPKRLRSVLGDAATLNKRILYIAGFSCLIYSVILVISFLS